MKSLCIGLSLILSAEVAYSDEINVPEIMLSRLNKEHPEVYAKSSLKRFCDIVNKFGFQKKERCGTVGITNIREIGQSVEYSEVKPAAIPVTVTKDTYLFKNCSSDVRNETRSLSVSYTEGYTLTTQDSITTGTQATAGLQIKALQLGIQATEQVSTSKTENLNRQKSVTENVNFNENIKPYTALLVTIEKRSSNDYLSFKGILNLDADVVVSPCCGVTGDRDSAGKYSNFFPNNMFAVRGEIWNVKGTSLTKSYQEITLDKNSPSQCPGFNVSVPLNTLPALQPNMLSNIAEFSAELEKSLSSVNSAVGDIALPLEDRASLPGLTTADASGGMQVTEPLTDGRTINTGDSVANVRVRAKSMGPGACGVQFSTFGGNAQFLAPPLVWSPWTVLVSHVGKATFTIGMDVKCDTGALAEVQYWK